MTIRVFMLWLAAALLLPAWVQAETDCEKEVLTPTDDGASGYLQSYGNDCLKDKMVAQWALWKLAVARGGRQESPEPMFDYPRLPLAWFDLSEKLHEIADSAHKDGVMKPVYRTFAGRARATGAALKNDLISGLDGGKSLYRTDAWHEIKMTLPIFRGDDGLQFGAVDVGKEADKDCEDRLSEACKDALRQGKKLMLYWGLARNLAGAVSDASLKAVAVQVAQKEALWNKYLYDSKPMLPLDFWMTDLIQRPKDDPFSKGVPAPPTRQWFFLHPSFGVEYASAARDGQQFRPVLYMEVFGVNYWNADQRPFNVPILNHFSGASLIVSYADRAGIKDTGVGMLLTFDNVYSVGIARYGSETGISISLDVANLFREELKPRYEAWKRGAVGQ
jgi:hypothetical protein